MTSSLTSYLYERRPNFYGGQQEDYLLRAEKAIHSGVATLEEGMAAKRSPKEIFFTLFEQFRHERHQIAIDHKTKNAELFGSLRADKENRQYVNFFSALTPLDNQYKEYGDRCLVHIRDCMKQMKHTLRTFDQTELDVKNEGLGRKNPCKIRVIEGPEIEKIIKCPPSIEQLQKALKTLKERDKILQDFGLMQRLKKEHPEFYSWLTKNAIFGQIFRDYPSPKTFKDGSYEGNLDHLKNLFPHCTLRLEINGKLYAIGQYITWMYQDYRTDPVDRMVKRSRVMVVHQDPFLIDETLEAISEIFQQAIMWDKKTDSLADLKNKVALLRYIYAFCMPCGRGDGAIGDWMEMAIYRYHGFTKTRHKPDTLPCFEPLAAVFLSNYLKRYDQTIEIK